MMTTTEGRKRNFITYVTTRLYCFLLLIFFQSASTEIFAFSPTTPSFSRQKHYYCSWSPACAGGGTCARGPRRPRSQSSSSSSSTTTVTARLSLLHCAATTTTTTTTTTKNDSNNKPLPSPNQNKKKQAPPTKIITCSSSKEIAHAIRNFLQPGDTVAELGSQLREVSTAICESISTSKSSSDDDNDNGNNGGGGGRAVLVDTARKFPTTTKSNINTVKDGSDKNQKKSADTHQPRTQAMRLEEGNDDFYSKFQHCSTNFIEIDQLDDWRNAFFPSSSSSSSSITTTTYDVFVLDLNSIVGNDLELTTLSIIREFLALNNNNNNKIIGGGCGGSDSEFDDNDRSYCRIVLVKSLSLNQWASRLIHGQRWINMMGEEEEEARGDGSLLQTTETTKKEQEAVVATAKATTAHHHRQQLHCRIVATVGVPEYRDTIPFTVRSGDAVLEIGCHLGTSTALIDQKASSSLSSKSSSTTGGGYCIGIDIGTKIIQGAKQRHPNIYFEVGDAWRTAELLRIQQNYLLLEASASTTDSASASASSSNIHIQQQQQQQQRPGSVNNQRIGFDVIYVDVGGLSGQDGIIESLTLLSALMNALEPRCIVIKSLCMRRLSSTLIPYWKLQKEEKKKRNKKHL